MLVHDVHTAIRADEALLEACLEWPRVLRGTSYFLERNQMTAELQMKWTDSIYNQVSDELTNNYYSLGVAVRQAKWDDLFAPANLILGFNFL